jgi:PAS domain S-box-containing protein
MGVAEALEHVNVPSYVIDATGIIRWVNPAAERIVGDVQGLQFTSVVSPEDTRRARELFARKIVGAARVTDSNVGVVGADGVRVAVEVSSVRFFAASTWSGSLDKSRTWSSNLMRIRTCTSHHARRRCSNYSSGVGRRPKSPRSST